MSMASGRPQGGRGGETHVDRGRGGKKQITCGRHKFLTLIVTGTGSLGG